MIEGPIKHPSSSTPGATPTSATLATLLDASTRAIEEGELLVNQADARLFMKTSPDGVVYDLLRRSMLKSNSGTYVTVAANASNISTMLLSGAHTYMLPVVPSFTFTASAIGFHISTAGTTGQIDIALVEADAENRYLPKDNPVYYQNGFTVTGTGTQDFVFPSPYVFTPSKPMYLALRTNCDATVRAFTPAAMHGYSLNFGSLGQSCTIQMPAAGIGGGGTGEEPDGTSGRWFNISTWSHVNLISGNCPCLAPKIA